MGRNLVSNTVLIGLCLTAIFYNLVACTSSGPSYLNALRGTNGSSPPSVQQPRSLSLSDIALEQQQEQRQPRGSYRSAVQRSGSDPGLYRPNHNRSNRWESQKQSGRDSCKTNYKFDYILLALSWGPGFCATSPQACSRVDNHFTIHGLWLNSRSGENPEYCCFDNSFNYNALSSILPDLNNYWYSNYGSSSRGFWSHEWLKHGTCARDVPSLRGELNYFGTTLDIFKKMPILETLKKANIVPSKSNSYTTAEINNALKSISNGKDIQVDCDYEHGQPIPILKQVNFCLDANLRFIDCPNMKRRCQSRVYFLN